MISNINMFKRDCLFITKKLMSLGKKIIQNMENEKIEKIFLDTDFKKRQVLKIIIENNIYSILADRKIDELLEDMWNGKEFGKCNGRIVDFSHVVSLYNQEISVLPNKKLKFVDLIQWGFKIKSWQMFFFHYRFRQRSIYFIYVKEFVCAFTMVMLFQFISY